MRRFDKALRDVDLKVLDEATGRVSAIVSTENIDRDGDIIRAEGWDLRNFQSHPVLLSSHEYSGLQNQIGTWESMEVRGTKVVGTARFYIGKGNLEADWAFELAKEKALAFSVGFIPDMDKASPLHAEDAFGFRGMEFRGQELLEVSAVTVPSNAASLQRFIKAMTPDVTRTEAADDLGATTAETDPRKPKVLEDVEGVEDAEDALVAKILERVLGEISNGDSNEEPDAEDDQADADDYGNGDAPEAPAPSNVDQFDPYAVASAATEQALQEAGQ
jgi:hypothetical protein